MTKRKWTDQDVFTLRFWYKDPYVTVREIADKMERTFWSIICKADELGLHKLDAFEQMVEEHLNEETLLRHGDLKRRRIDGRSLPGKHRRR